MSSLTRQEPPRARLPSGWPVRRTPRWVLLAGVVLVLAVVAVSLVHKPSQAERASDMRGFLTEVTSDIQSCAGGVSESLAALRLIQSGQAGGGTDVSDGISIARQGADNCSPANSDQINNLEQYQAPESLASFGLSEAVTGLVTWAAPDAQRVQTDVANVLAAATPAARARAQTALTRDLATLNAQRAKIDALIETAIRKLAMHASPPRLPT